MRKGNVYIISAPSGCGKGTVLAAVFAQLKKPYYFSISVTTRAPRPGEQEGVQYFFVSREKFQTMVERDELLEYAEYVGNQYGTPRAPVIENVAAGKNVFLEIEIKGFQQIKKKLPEAISIFIAPPSIEELERRLRGRSTETEEKLRGRLEKAKKEMHEAALFDYIVVNDQVERAAGEIISIIETNQNMQESRL